MTPLLRTFDLLPGELVIDNFAGGGGASTGIEAAIGRPCDIAINHDPVAITMHKANHPATKHYVEDVWAVDPREATGGRPVGLAWFSPDCRHFSSAKGSAPVSDSVRGLAWVVVRWAREARPRVIVLENVEEFQTWGPLDEHHMPIKSRAGETFREWLAAIVACGYSVEFQTLVAADYGTPTTRKRLFLIARRDGRGIVWPEASHGRARPAPWRTAAEVIDWSLPAPSIFGRSRPLAEATLKRIAAGVQRYVIGAARPFIVPVKSWGGGGNGPRNLDAPMPTVTAAKRGEFALISPFVVRHGHYSTITGAGLVEGAGAGTFRGQPLALPLATVCATNDKHLVCPILTKHYGGVIGHEVTRPVGTVTAKDHHALTAALLTRTEAGQRASGVRAFLLKYYSASGRAQTADLFDPLHTVTTKARFGLVVVEGETYQISDIGMRMLAPHELFAAQGFPPGYEIRPSYYGKPISKTDQTRLAGNSVCPPVARALVAANIRSAA